MDVQIKYLMICFLVFFQEEIESRWRTNEASVHKTVIDPLQTIKLAFGQVGKVTTGTKRGPLSVPGSCREALVSSQEHTTGLGASESHRSFED